MSYTDSTLPASTSQRKGVLVRAPFSLKAALVRETARRDGGLNDVAVGLLADAFGVDYTPTNRKSTLPGSSPVILLRMPEELKREIQAEAFRSASNTNDVIVRSLADSLGIPHETTQRRSVPFGGGRGKDTTMAATNGSTNGAKRQKDKVRVALIGVGNCANSLLQGVEYYKDANPEDSVPGLMHVNLGGYHISDIEFTAAFDVVKGKVGEDLADAIWAHPNDTIKFAKVPKTGIKVSRGMTHDGLGKYLSEIVEKAPGETDDIVGILKETGTDVVVNYLPVGSEAATKWYTERILEAGVAMVNCMPVFIAREPYWQKRFAKAGVPIIGDDIKSQVGATIMHRVLTTLFGDRGVHLDRTMQLNVGGNSDFLNMLERERLESKKISKTNAVTSMLDYDIGAKNVHVGPSDYVPWLTDRKWAYIRMEGSAFGDVPLNCELKLEVWDSPNSAGIVIDAVRLAKLALNNGISGALEAPSSYLMKSPPLQIRDDESRESVERYITKNAVKTAKAAAKA
jgi:myo-inositol-1-phosphate synthase